MTSTEQEGIMHRQRWHVIALVFVAPASMALGFFIVLELSGGTDRLFVRLRPPIVKQDRVGDASVQSTNDDALASASSINSDTPQLDGLQARPALPVSMGEPFYFRCWDTGKQAPMTNDACGRVRPFERLIASRLGIVAHCYEGLDRPETTGELSLGVDLRFGADIEEDLQKTKSPTKEPPEQGSVRFWAGRSTTLEDSEAIISCLQNRIGELSLNGIRHRHDRYTIFFPVRFGAEDLEGTPVEMVLDRVRLREEPVKGKIIARLRRGEPVSVLEVREDWVKIRTVDGRNGWVFSGAIAVPEP